MCGIAGFVSPDRPQAIEASVRRMMRELALRGPDSEGFEAWPGVGFGHRRLAILDLSPAGHQPMLSDDRSIGIVFNGCIYNFMDLRSELEQHGHRFRSNCDTEVLVRGYQQWGIEELSRRTRGMFAFAIWDQPQRTLYLVRDRLGVKPLVYSAAGKRIAFASTVQALHAAGFSGDVDPTAVLQFMDYGNLASDQCIFQGLRKLPPATILRWKDGQSSESTYWSLPHWDESSRITFEEAVEETERLIIESTRLRLIADVPVSALLSGGVDSTLVCWAICRLNVNLTAVTLGIEGDPSDESEYARQTAQQLGIPHQVVELPADTTDVFGESDFAYSEPFASPSAKAMLRVSRAVKPMAKVLLTGDGGDDVFLGYPHLYSAWVSQQAARRIPSFAAPLIRAAGSCLPRVGVFRRARHFSQYITSGFSAYVDVNNGLRYLGQRGILGDRLEGIQLPHRNHIPSLEAGRNLFSDVLDHHHRVHFVGEFMPKVDEATMYYSLEARSPFLDQKLWEFAATLPPAIRFRGGVLKAILREIVRRRVNPAVANRPKLGFTVPVERLLADKWSGALDILQSPNELERQGWIRPHSLAAPIAEAKAQRWVPKQIWCLLLLEHWLQRQSSQAPELVAEHS